MIIWYIVECMMIMNDMKDNGKYNNKNRSSTRMTQAK
jgi:hypothetical protein